MDWSRTKTIFIIAFTILNVFLAVQIWVFPNALEGQITQNEIIMIRDQLASQNLSIQTNIPDRVYSKRMLTTATPKTVYSELKSAFFSNSNIKSEQRDNNTYIVTSDRSKLVVTPEGKITYTETNGLIVIPINEESAVSMAERFASTTLPLPSDARLSGVKAIGDDEYVVEYYQVFKRNRIDASYIRFTVTPRGVTTYERYWVEPLNFSGNEYLIIPSTGALMRFADLYSKKGIITNLTLSYYSEPLRAGQWQMVPVWQIEVDNKDLYFFNAYTGELEGIRALNYIGN